MQDRFKFRVWHKKRKKMYDVLHFHTQTWHNGGEWVTAKGFNIITQQDIHIQVEPKDGVIMQCSGLKDKNGKLIYEGDIVKQNQTIYSVNWCEGSYCFLNNKNLVNYTVESVTPARQVVIGNIYENPELLKDGE